MHIVRMLRSGVVLAGLAFFAMAMLPGCGDQSTESGTQVTVDPAEASKREKNIQDMYKSTPPGKGPQGQLPPGSKK